MAAGARWQRDGAEGIPRAERGDERERGDGKGERGAGKREQEAMVGVEMRSGEWGEVVGWEVASTGETGNGHGDAGGRNG